MSFSPKARRRIESELNLLLLAMQFLTRLTLPITIDYSSEKLNASVRYYPVIGLLLGLLLAFTYWLLSLAFPVLISVILCLGLSLLITGAFHEDGFADLCDGIGGGNDIERSLEIMRDSRLGTYGVAGLIILLSCKIAALNELDNMMLLALVLGHSLSRASAVLVIVTSAYVHVGKASTNTSAKPVAENLSHETKVICLLNVSLILLVCAIGFDTKAVLIALVGAACGHLLVRYCFEKRLKGYTGDCLGAVQQGSELGIYLALLLLI